MSPKSHDGASGWIWTSVCAGFAAGIFVGLLAGIALSLSDVVKLTGSITAGELLQAFCTVGVAFIVAMYVQRIVQSDRREKDLLMTQFDLLLDLVHQFEELDHSVALVDVTSLLKKLSQKCTLITELIGYCGYSGADDATAGFAGHIQRLRYLATNTPNQGVEEFAKSDACPTNVSNGIITWANDRKRDMELELEQFKAAIFRAQLIVNKL